MNPSYTGPRQDIARLIPENSKRILDLGCSNGALGANLKKAQPGLVVHGVELDPEMARQAGDQLDKVVCDNLETADLAAHFAGEHYDCLVFADVLEHLRDPWTVLARSAALLDPGGCVVTSIPNIRHASTLVNLVFRGYWPYRDRGIQDRTHLRWFTLRNVKELVAGAGLEIETLKRNLRFVERPAAVNGAAGIVGWIPVLREFFTFQYLVVARKR